MEKNYKFYKRRSMIYSLLLVAFMILTVIILSTTKDHPSYSIWQYDAVLMIIGAFGAFLLSRMYENKGLEWLRNQSLLKKRELFRDVIVLVEKGNYEDALKSYNNSAVSDYEKEFLFGLLVGVCLNDTNLSKDAREYLKKVFNDNC